MGYVFLLCLQSGICCYESLHINLFFPQFSMCATFRSSCSLVGWRTSGRVTSCFVTLSTPTPSSMSPSSVIPNLVRKIYRNFVIELVFSSCPCCVVVLLCGVHFCMASEPLQLHRKVCLAASCSPASSLQTIHPQHLHAASPCSGDVLQMGVPGGLHRPRLSYAPL